MPEVVTVGCKVNLYLDITGVRDNGYHELETLFFPVAEPSDTLELTPGGPESAGLTLTCSDKALEGRSNLVAKAYEAFAALTGFRPALAARLVKRTPSGAGLGGGSADAAALLAWLNARAGDKALSPDELAALAVRLGADVPFFLTGAPAWATGVGDQLTPAACDLSGLTMLVCMPEERVDTAWAYRAWDESHGITGRQGSKPALTSLCPASMRPFCVSGTFMANCFEAVVFKRHPAVRLLKERLLALGAAAACMSGSGSAVFGLFRDPARAIAAVSALSGPQTSVFCALL
ncbi:4-(cytidine 5'-diphospho)-2-C-methyl-D-erythritol kinase [Fundidesulfovibrio terrae]|uniref:4-(cytidine 5'-diphospho)-2-C-methyl-D-erythritol kinase n=1 Tax=Fundidesulfovibrio terrae TaxID=2922866 RepID=UPI001FAE8E21|nr:4-(cytidine 5'-diphospho)-2-C-methyl-D-erythritol kinase [Fundidesulfovibrio terrae]